jgi:hypothetical protein
MQTGTDLESVFSRSLKLLSENWIIVVPGLILALLGAFVSYSAGPAFVYDSGDGMTVYNPAAMVGRMFAPIVGLVVSILAISFITGMAGAAWRSGKATLDDGLAAFRRDGVQIFLGIVLLFVLGFIAVILSLPTFGLAMFAFMIFFLYTFAGIVVGDESATTAIGESFRIATRNFLTTLLVVVLIFVIAIIAGLIAGVFAFVPLVGTLVSLVIQQVIVAYATLVIVGEYLKLRGSAVDRPAAPPPPAV